MILSGFRFFIEAKKQIFIYKLAYFTTKRDDEMKQLTLFTFILALASPAYAIEITNTGIEGASPVIYGDIIVFYSGAELKLYDLSTKEVKSIAVNAKNPSVFGFYVAFEDENGTISYYDARTESSAVTEAKGSVPTVYGENIAFSVPEALNSVDINNDGDIDDYILYYYQIGDAKLINTRIIGRNPSLSRKTIAFETSEAEVGHDLNGDDDSGDVVIRYYDLLKKNTSNTNIAGKNPKVFKDRFIVFLNENNELSYYNINTAESISTRIAADSYSIFEDTIVYGSNNLLGSYYLPSKTKAKTEIYGSQPSLFEKTIAFATSEKFVGDLNSDKDANDSIIRYLKAGDIDSDGVIDFADNCIDMQNSGQGDDDNDGIGNECDDFVGEKTEGVPVEAIEKPAEQVHELQPAEPEERKPLPETLTVAKKKSGKLGLVFAVLAIFAVALITAFYLPPYIRRRRKSFGF